MEVSNEELQRDFEAWMVWNERKALLGAAYLLCPSPFEELTQVLQRIPPGPLGALASLSWGPPEVKEIERFLQDHEGRFWRGWPAWGALEYWRREVFPKRACALQGRRGAFPEAWRAWAYPLLAGIAEALEPWKPYPEPWTQGHRFLHELEHAFKVGVAEAVWSDPSPPREDLWGELRPYPWESRWEFLRRAEAHYDFWKKRREALGEETPYAKRPKWATRHRDLLLYALEELFGLTRDQVGSLGEELRTSPGPLGEYLRQGRRPKGRQEKTPHENRLKGEETPPLSPLDYDTVSKIVAIVKERLRLP